MLDKHRILQVTIASIIMSSLMHGMEPAYKAASHVYDPTNISEKKLRMAFDLPNQPARQPFQTCSPQKIIDSTVAALAKDECTLIKGNHLATAYKFGKQALSADHDPEDYGFIKIKRKDLDAMEYGQKVLIGRARSYVYGLKDIEPRRIAVKIVVDPWLHIESLVSMGAILPYTQLYTHPSWIGDAAIANEALEKIENIGINLSNRTGGAEPKDSSSTTATDAEQTMPFEPTTLSHLTSMVENALTVPTLGQLLDGEETVALSTEQEAWHITQKMFEATLNTFEHLMMDQLNNLRKWVGPPATFDLETQDYAKQRGRCGLYLSYEPDPFRPFIQKKILNPETHIIFFGDIHGEAEALLAGLRATGAVDEHLVIEKDHVFVFTGDYIDRGQHGLETIYTLMQLKIANPDRVILLRGNHEIIRTSGAYGFFGNGINAMGNFGAFAFPFAGEVGQKFGIIEKSAFIQLSERYAKWFELLPVALVIGTESDYILACHGGLHPMKKPKKALYIDIATHQTFNPFRAASMHKLLHGPDERAFMLLPGHWQETADLGFIWSDFRPVDQMAGYKESDRGAGWFFDPKKTKEYLRRYSHEGRSIHAIVRGHDHYGAPVGVGQLMNGMITTLISTTFKDVPGYADVINFNQYSYLDLKLAQRWEDWRLQHHTGDGTINLLLPEAEKGHEPAWLTELMLEDEASEDYTDGNDADDYVLDNAWPPKIEDDYELGRLSPIQEEEDPVNEEAGTAGPPAL